MRLFEDICEKHKVEKDAVEADLYDILGRFANRKRLIDYGNEDYAKDLHGYLQKESCIEFRFPGYTITEIGKSRLARGYIAINTSKSRKERRLSIAVKVVGMLAGIVSLVAAIIGLCAS